MAQNDPVVNRIRIIPRKDDFLDRNVGSSGEIFYSKDVNTLRLYSGNDKGGFEVVTEDNIRRNIAAEEVATIKYTVQVENQSDTANRYVLNTEYYPKITFMRGYTYVFDQSDQTNVYYPNPEGGTINAHPLLFSTTQNGSHATPTPGVPYETGVIYLLEDLPVTRAKYIQKFSSATSRKIQITVTVSTPETLYYYCYYHSGMGNEITVSYPGTGTGGASITVSDTAPEEPTNGNLWYKSDDGKLLVYVTDTDSSQWVQPSVPIAATNSGTPNTFKTITTSDSTSLVANGESTLTIAEGTGLEIATNTGNNTITFSNPYDNLQAITANGNTSTVDLSLAQVTANSFVRKINRLTGASGVVEHDVSNSTVFYHTGMGADWTTNITNLNIDGDTEVIVRLIVAQSSTAYVPTGLQIDGVAQTIFWRAGSAPNGTSGGFDRIDYYITKNVNNTYAVLVDTTSHNDSV